MASAVLVILAALVLVACELPRPVPEPAQDAVLDEAYLVYPGATKTSEEFTRGYTRGLNVDGGETREPSRLEIHYKLDQPIQLKRIWDWYDKQLEPDGWSSYQDTYGLHLKKEIDNRYHSIGVTYDYKAPITGEDVVDSYTVGYGIGFEAEPPGG